MITMSDEEMEANAAEIERAAAEFSETFGRVKARVLNATWEGAAAAAFQACFADASVDFDRMVLEIGQIAQVLRLAKNGMSQADSEIAQGIAANTGRA
jgi:WXG100 family type VII secretion target